MHEYIETALKEMCSRVNAKYEDVDFQENWWFMNYSWTKEQEDDYLKWLTNYLKPIKVRSVFTDFPRIYKEDKVASWFVLNYGWKTKEK